MKVFFDFETRSVCELKDTGAYVYSNHPTTEIICMAWAVDGGPVKIYRPLEKDPYPSEVIDALFSGAEFIAHNAQFEKVMWNNCCVRRYGWPRLPVEQLHCTMVMAYAMGLMGALENAAKCVGLDVEKDMAGNRVMLQLAKPRSYCEKTGQITWWEKEDSTPKLDIAAKYDAVYEYCKQDIVVTRELYGRLMTLDPIERKTWLLDQEINDRGVYVDKKAAVNAVKLAALETKILNGTMQELTGNAVSTCNAHAALKKWVIANGATTDSVDKNAIFGLLEQDIPQHVKNVLMIRQWAGKSSVNKLKRMADSVDPHRVKGCFQYHGASATGRWAGRGIQLHNLPRPELKQDQIEAVLDLIGSDKKIPDIREEIELIHGPPLKVLSSCIRGFLTARPGNKFIAVDFSAIEARVLAWLAGEESVLEVFRTHGRLYEAAAAYIYGVGIDDVTSEQRMIGKVASLALGYQGGVGAFQTMAKSYQLKITDAQADDIKLRWRAAHPNITGLWHQLENAAVAAIKSPGEKFHAGKAGRHVTYLKKGSFLLCRLPSGRIMVYPYPEMRVVKTPWGEPKHAMTYRSEQDRQWRRHAAYAGLLAENVVQATARDLLRDAMFRWEEKEYPIVMHVHDEIVAEVPKHDTTKTLAEAIRLTSTVPDWAAGLPIGAEGWEGERYRK